MDIAMTNASALHGRLMAAEIAEAPEVFARSALTDCRQQVSELGLGNLISIYTIARGSSDAAANVMAYEMMREMRIPVTSLPPSVFSVGEGVGLKGAGVLIVSQSGASDDLVRCAEGALSQTAPVMAITNQPRSPVESIANVIFPIAAGPEIAVPATKTVIGSIAVGMSILSALSGDYADRTKRSVDAFVAAKDSTHSDLDVLRAALLRHQHIYVVGRDVGFGAAQEIALKIKETCAIQAEAYSSSEVLHGPLQLATRSMFVLILDTGQPDYNDSLNIAENRFAAAGVTVLRLRVRDLSGAEMTPTTAAAFLLFQIYSVIQQVAVALGYNPDAPSTLKKVTTTL